MAAEPPPHSGLLTPSTSTIGHATAPDRPKLRNSCHSCASSKLKCSQDKPTCSRCAKRGFTCEYVAAKPGGRKPNSQLSNNNNHGNDAAKTAKAANANAYPPSQANWFAPSSSNPSTESLRSPGKVHHSPIANVSGSSDVLQDFFSPMEQTLVSTPTENGTAFDDFFNSPIAFSTDLSDMSIFGPADFFSTATDSNSTCSNSLSDTFPVFEDAVSELLAQSIPSSTPPNSTSPTKEQHNYQQVRATESPCSCLIQALGFMKQLFPSASNACTTWATQGLDKATTIPTIQAVITRNEATVEAVSTMLKCSCSQDGYLLSIMSLIIFRILGWYAAIARKTPSLHSSQACCSPSEPAFQSSTVVGSYCLDGADSDRMVAQLVLSELHRVRLLVDQLSSKLKGQAAAQKGRGGFETPESMDLDNEMTLSLSAVMYDQLDNDLRNRLRTLSCEMLDRLRRL